VIAVVFAALAAFTNAVASVMERIGVESAPESLRSRPVSSAMP